MEGALALRWGYQRDALQQRQCIRRAGDPPPVPPECIGLPHGRRQLYDRVSYCGGACANACCTPEH
eukprot:4377407-Amphidinium_carterae.1